jgi:hypothetical protein
MRRITAMLILIVSAMPLQAENWREFCGSMGELAATIMENRQSGVSMATMMEAVPGEGNSTSELSETLIISAFETPRYSTDQMQKRAVEEFRDEAYLSCVKAKRSQTK